MQEAIIEKVRLKLFTVDTEMRLYRIALGCRIVLCNDVPDCLQNEAVKSRYILYSLEDSIISEESMHAGLRQRTSYLDEGELADDDEF